MTAGNFTFFSYVALIIVCHAYTSCAFRQYYSVHSSTCHVVYCV